jgi:hypothetical protein
MMKSRKYEAPHFAFFCCCLPFYPPSSPVIRHDLHPSVPHSIIVSAILAQLATQSSNFSAITYLLHCRLSRTLNEAVSPFFLEQLATDVFILCTMALYVTVVSLQATIPQLNINSLQSEVHVSNVQTFSSCLAEKRRNSGRLVLGWL